MRLFPPRLAALACLAVAAPPVWSQQPPVPAPLPPPPPAAAAVPAPEPCPPEPCPPEPCPPARRTILCPPARVGPVCPPVQVRSAAAPRQICVQVLPSEIEFRRAPSCAPACATPGCTTCTPNHQGVGGRPQAFGAPHAAAPAMVTVPVQSYHYVPVTSLQAVPVTTFQTVPASAVGFGVTGQTFGVTGQAFGMPAQSFGVGPVAPFGAGFGAAPPQAAGVSDAELRALRALLQLGTGTGQPRAAAAEPAAAGAKGGCDTAAQFEALELRLERLKNAVVKNTQDINNLEGRVQSLETWRRELAIPPAIPPANPLANPIPRSADALPPPR